MSELKIPTTAEEARAMAALGFKWLEDNAPEQLTQHWRDIKAEAGRAGFVACAAEFGFYLTGHQVNIVNEAADQYAERTRSGSQP